MQRRIKAMQLKNVIYDFCRFNPACSIAHIALEDYNLSDKTIAWLLREYIPESTLEYLKDFPERTMQDIAGVVAFLEMLLWIDEEVREGILEEYDD